MKIDLEIDLEKFKYSLIGDGYTREEVMKFSEERLIGILKYRIDRHINVEYSKGLRFGLYD